MKMMKISAAFIAAAMITAASIIPVSAENKFIEEMPTNTDIDVYGTLKTYSTETVYSTDITWESLDFEYQDAYVGEWNPATHMYDGAHEARFASSADEITVTNRSNVPVKAEFKYSPAEEYGSISGSFTDANGEELSGSCEIASAAPEDIDQTGEEQTVTVKLALDGEFDGDYDEKFTVGSVTVTLRDV